jgi:hypothetical protein
MAHPLGVRDLYAIPYESVLEQFAVLNQATGLYALVAANHNECDLSTFCRNPLHPGPCKGWKHTLGVVAPGALHQIEKVRLEKVHAKRVATAHAKGEAVKHVAGLHPRELAHPLAAKKAGIKHAEKILGTHEVSAANKMAKAKLSKVEIGRFSKIKGAAVAQLAVSRGLTSDEKKYARFARVKIAEALAKDNEDGGDKHYRHALDVIAGALSMQYADQKLPKCKEGDADCDGIAWEALRMHAQDKLRGAFLYGGTDQLDQLDKDVAKLADNPGALKTYLASHGVDMKEAAQVSDTAFVERPQPTLPEAPDDEGKVAAGASFLQQVMKAMGTEVNAEQAKTSVEAMQDWPDDKFEQLGNSLASKIVNKVEKASGKHLDPLERMSVEMALSEEIAHALKGGKGGTPVLNATATDDLGHVLSEADKKMAGKLAPGAPVADVPPHIDMATKIALGKVSVGDKAAIEAYDSLTKDEFDALPDNIQAAVLNDLDTTAKFAVDPADSIAAMTVWHKLASPELKQALFDKTAAEQAVVDKALADLDANAELNAQLDVLDTKLVDSTPELNLSPAAQKAYDLAEGLEKTTATKKLAAYGKLNADDIGALPDSTKAEIVKDMKEAKAKFLDPKKQASAQAVIDQIEAAQGGGAGAGGPASAPLAQSTNELKAKQTAGYFASWTR